MGSPVAFGDWGDTTMEILGNFGFKPELFVAQVINFLILAIVFKRYLYKPLLSVIKKREETIQKGLSDAKDSAILKEETEKERSVILKKTRAEVDEIMTDAKKMAEELRSKTREETQLDAQKIMTQAKLQAELEMQKMEMKIKKMSLELSSELLDKVLRNAFSPEERIKIVKRTIKQID